MFCLSYILSEFLSPHVVLLGNVIFPGLSVDQSWLGNRSLAHKPTIACLLCALCNFVLCVPKIYLIFTSLR